MVQMREALVIGRATMNSERPPGAEKNRLEEQHLGKEDWFLWGPYLAERAKGTVREDYSPGGICDCEQRLCFALALWNGRDPILKERAFGLTGNQGNQRRRRERILLLSGRCRRNDHRIYARRIHIRRFRR